MTQEKLLEVQRLSKTFPGLKALDGVSFSVKIGEVVGLVGQNGSGKSTLVKTLADVHEPDPGSRIMLDGGSGAAPTKLHFIHQDLALVGSLSTVENLDLDHRLGRRAYCRRRDGSSPTGPEPCWEASASSSTSGDRCRS